MDRAGEVRPELERCRPMAHPYRVGHGTLRVQDGKAGNVLLAWPGAAGVWGNMKDQG